MRQRLIRNGVFATSQVIVTTAAMFIVYRMVTHRFGLQLLGVWSSALAVSSLVSLGDCGLSDIMVRQVAEALGREEWHEARALHSALTRLSVFGLAAAAGIAAPLIYAILQPAVPASLSVAFPQIVTGAVCVSVMTNMTTAQFGVLEAFGMYGTRIALALGSALIMIAVSWFCVRANRPDVIAVIFISGSLWSSVAAYAIGRGLLSRRSRLKYRIPLPQLVRIFRIAVAIRMAGLLNLGLDPITRVALARYAGVEAAGLYEIAYRVIFQLRAALVSGLQTIVPYLSRKLRGSGPQSKATVVAAAGIAISVGIPVFTVAVLGMPALSIVVTARSSPAIGSYAAILAVAWMINVASAPGYFANIVEGRVHRNWISQGVMCTVNAGLAPLLGFLWGAIGVCFGAASAVAAGSLANLAGRGQETWELLHRLSRGDYLALFGGAAAATTVNLAWHAGMAGTSLFTLEVAVTLAYLLTIAPALIMRVRSLSLARGQAS